MTRPAARCGPSPAPGMVTRRDAITTGMAALALPAAARAQSAADFFMGKTIRFWVGVAPGGATDYVARTIAAHLGRHVPGNPIIQPENMPGASSLVMTNALYNKGPRDGTLIGISLNGVVLEPKLQLMKGSGQAVLFDTNRINWIGTPSHLPHVVWVRADAPVQTFEDLRKSKVVLGAISPGSDSHILPRLMNTTLGTRFEIIGGYQGVNEIFLAAERGEVQGAIVGIANLTSTKPEWLRDRKIRILLQFATERSHELPDIPTAVEVAQNEDSRAMLALYATKFQVAFPVFTPPDVPKDRLEALRSAFIATMKDPRFLEDAKRGGIDIDPLSGEDVARAVHAIDATPPAVIERLRTVIGG